MVDQRVGVILAGSATSLEEIGTLTKELKGATQEGVRNGHMFRNSAS